jgi:hypothetical protein
MPAWISDETIHGRVPSAEYNGLQVHGSYAGALLIQSNTVPSGYATMVASGGPNSDFTPVAVREHPNPAYQLAAYSGVGVVLALEVRVWPALTPTGLTLFHGQCRLSMKNVNHADYQYDWDS